MLTHTPFVKLQLIGLMKILQRQCHTQALQALMLSRHTTQIPKSIDKHQSQANKKKTAQANQPRTKQQPQNAKSAKAPKHRPHQPKATKKKSQEPSPRAQTVTKSPS